MAEAVSYKFKSNMLEIRHCVINGLIEFFALLHFLKGMVEIRFCYRIIAKHSHSKFSNLAIYLQSLKCSVFNCSVLFGLTKKNVDIAKSLEHITIKDKNQSSQLDWCKITVTIAKVCILLYTQYYTKEKNQSEWVCFIIVVILLW